MKVLAMFVSLLFGAAVLALFLQPWAFRQDAAEPRGLASVGAPEPEPVAPHPQPAPDAEVRQSIEVPASGRQSNAAPEPEPESKTVLLANEKAEAERMAALEEKHATTPEPETKRYFKVKVRDAGTLEADLPDGGSVVIRLDGIDAQGADEECTREDGSSWPCGAKARAALKLFVRSRAVTCALPPGGESAEFASRCQVANQDLATWLVRRGWATPEEGEQGPLTEALAEAKSEEVGLWERQ